MFIKVWQVEDLQVSFKFSLVGLKKGFITAQNRIYLKHRPVHKSV